MPACRCQMSGVRSASSGPVCCACSCITWSSFAARSEDETRYVPAAISLRRAHTLATRTVPLDRTCAIASGFAFNSGLLVRARLYDPICSMIAIATTSLFGVCFAAYPGGRPGHGHLFFEAAPQIQSRQEVCSPILHRHRHLTL